MGIPTYQPIANITLGSATANVGFTGITQQYRDLVLVTNVNLSASQNIALRLNYDDGNNYSFVYMIGNGSSTGSASGSNLSFIQATSVSFTNNGQAIFNIMDYSAADKHKSVLVRYNNAGTETFAGAGRWANNTPVNSFYVTFFGANAAAGSTFALYGVIA